ncbi:protein NYNRIN-like [Rana temporaria]|uniref:protein NYNRIN-like n=1 Tax=Rana temporaria TaxID=8407 RepID=UPI001AADF1D6|nr:protein NYNRIN-like [Rana temporaria]
MVLNQSLTDWVPEHGSVLIQYVDDLLIGNGTEIGCSNDSVNLLDHLADKGHLASFKKVQWCSSRVEYLGAVISEGARLVSPARVEAISALSRPSDKRSLLSFLGSIVYCRQWIPDCSFHDSVLRKATLATAPKQITWTPEMVTAYDMLVRSLRNAPALGLIQHGRPFSLYCLVMGNTMAAVLTQEHGGKQRPVTYISKKLPVQVQGMPACLQALAACALAVQAAEKLVLASPMTLFTTHTVTQLMQNMNTQHMTAQRLSGYEIILLNTQNLEIKTCPSTTPIVRFLHSLLKLMPESEPVPEHNCEDLISQTTSPRADLRENPLEGGIDIYVDGSCTRPDDKTYRTGYAVVQLPNIIHEAKPLVAKSAQEAELTALIRACQLFTNQIVNIYTDSRYAHGIVFDFGKIWQRRGYLTAEGKPIAHQTLIETLLDAIHLPKAIAVIKVKAHTTSRTTEALGNAFADKVAKQAADTIPAQDTPVTSMFYMNDFSAPDFKTTVMLLQSMALPIDISDWMQHNLAKDPSGLWTNKEGIMGIPKSVAPLIISYIHGPCHIGRKPILKQYRDHFQTEGLIKIIQDFVSSCVTCAQNNVQGKAMGRHGNLPPPLGPLTDLQIDFTHMPKQKGNVKYLLVIVDKFSGWVEAVPTTGETAGIAVRAIINNWVSRFGLPVNIWSDQGPAFASRLTQEFSKILGIQWKLHIPYHPQSAGIVERMNRNIKDKLNKATQGTMKNWSLYLPGVLYQIRVTPNSRGYSPFEVLMGHPPAENSVGKDNDLFSQQETWMKHLVSTIQHTQEGVAVTFSPLSTDPTHPFIPGDEVLVKQLAVRRKTGPIYQGPYTVEKVSRTAVKVEGLGPWIHASRLKKGPLKIKTPEAPMAPPLERGLENKEDTKLEAPMAPPLERGLKNKEDAKPETLMAPSIEQGSGKTST